MYTFISKYELNYVKNICFQFDYIKKYISINCAKFFLFYNIILGTNILIFTFETKFRFEIE